MKSFIIAMCLLVSTISFAQKDNTGILQQKCLSIIKLAPNLPKINFGVVDITVTKLNKQEKTVNAAFHYDEYEQCTIIMFEDKDGAFCVAGYAPIIKHGITYEYGNFIVYKKQKGAITTVINCTGKIEKKFEYGQITETLFSGDKKSFVQVTGKTYVDFMKFDSRLFWFPPKLQ